MTEVLPDMINNKVVRVSLQNIINEYGPGLFSVPNEGPIASIPTGSIALDYATGVGGVPMGRLVVIAGEPSTAKSTLCMEIVKNAQKLHPKKLNLYVDMESGAFTDEYALAIGIDPDPNKFLLIRPDYLEQGLTIVYNLITTGSVAVCVWDSIAGGRMTKEAAANSAEDSESMASVARILSRELPKLANKCGKTGTCLLLVNQMRTQMGSAMSWNDITGGKAQKFYSSLRIDLSKDKERDYSGNVDRETITAKIVKNKVAKPYRMAEFDIKLGEGILKQANILGLAMSIGVPQVIAKGGGNFYFFSFDTGEELVHVKGKDKAVDWLIENQDYADILESKILGFNRTGEFEQTISEEEIEEFKKEEELFGEVSEQTVEEETNSDPLERALEMI